MELAYSRYSVLDSELVRQFPHGGIYVAVFPPQIW